MRPDREDGYILASVIVAMLVLGALATGLTMVAVSELRRTRDHEQRVVDEATLYAGVALTAAELSLEPDTRSVRFDGGTDLLNIEGRQIEVRLAWESHKVDLNAGSLALIEAQALSSGLSADDRAMLMSRVNNLRVNQLELRLLDDIVTDGFGEPDCVRAAFTVFSGRRREAEPISMDGEFERPTPGTRIAMFLNLLPEGRAASVVVLMTGDPVDPARIQDWRWRDTRQILPCVEGE